MSAGQLPVKTDIVRDDKPTERQEVMITAYLQHIHSICTGHGTDVLPICTGLQVDAGIGRVFICGNIRCVNASLTFDVRFMRHSFVPPAFCLVGMQ